MFLEGYVCMCAGGENPVCVGWMVVRGAGTGYWLHYSGPPPVSPPPSISPSGVLPTCILLDCRAGQTIKAGKYQQPQNGGPGRRNRPGTMFWECERRRWIIQCVMKDCVSSVDLVTHYNKPENFVQQCNYVLKYSIKSPSD